MSMFVNSINSDSDKTSTLPNVPYDYKPTTKDIVKVQGDGNCLYHVLVLGLRTLGLLTGDQGTPYLRKLIQDELKKILIDDTGNINLNVSYSPSEKIGSAENNLTIGQYIEYRFEKENLDTDEKKINFLKEYIKNVVNDKTWGTDIDIWALSKIFPSVCIEVYTVPKGNSNELQILNNCNDQYYDDGDVKNIKKNIIRIYNASGNTEGGVHFDALPVTKNTDNKEKKDVEKDSPKDDTQKVVEADVTTLSSPVTNPSPTSGSGVGPTPGKGSIPIPKPEPKPESKPEPKPESKQEPEKYVLKPAPKLNYPIDKMPITVPNSLVIYLTTNVPGFQKIKFVPNMIQPNINKYVNTIFFDPIIPLDSDVIKKTPKDLLKTQFFDKGLFFTLKNRTLTTSTSSFDIWKNFFEKDPLKNPYSILKKNENPVEKQMETSINNGIINNNIRTTINTLFKTGSVIYLDNKPYTIYAARWTPGDWKIDTNNNLPDFLSTGQYYGPYSSYQGGPASQSALNVHPSERFRQPTIYITNSSSNDQSSPLQIQNAEKQLNSIPRKLISGPGYNEKEFSNISTLHPKEWRLLPSGNKQPVLTYPVDDKKLKIEDLERNRYNPNLPQILPPAPQNNPLLLEDSSTYTYNKPNVLPGQIENSPYQSQPLQSTNNLRLTNGNESSIPKRITNGENDKNQNNLRIENNRDVIPVNPYYNNKPPLLLQNAGASQKSSSIKQKDLRDFFFNFYNDINQYYKNMNDKEKHFFEYILNTKNEIVEKGKLPDNLREPDYCCNKNGNSLQNIFVLVQEAEQENSFFDCIVAGIKKYNDEKTEEDKIACCYKKSPDNKEGDNIEDRIADCIDIDGMKLAVYYYFMDHPDEYHEYLENKNIQTICDEMNQLFQKMITQPDPDNKGLEIIRIPNMENEYQNIIQDIYTKLSIKNPVLGINIPRFEEEYKIYKDNKLEKPFEIVEIINEDNLKKFKEYMIYADFLVDDKIFEIIRKKYGIKVVIIEKIAQGYRIKNQDIILNPLNNDNYPHWNKYMFLLLDHDGHYDLLTFVTRKTYWCDENTKTSLFLKEDQNYIWNVPPIYIIYLMFLTCFLPKLFNVADKKEFIQSIDLFKDDYIIFSNVYEKIHNYMNDPKNMNELGKTPLELKNAIEKVKKYNNNIQESEKKAEIRKAEIIEQEKKNYRLKTWEKIEKIYKNTKKSLTKLLTRNTIGAQTSKDYTKVKDSSKQIDNLNKSYDTVKNKPENDTYINGFLNMFGNKKDEHKDGLKKIEDETNKKDVTEFMDDTPDENGRSEKSNYNRAILEKETYDKVIKDNELIESNKIFFQDFIQTFNSLNDTKLDINKITETISEINDETPETDKEAVGVPPDDNLGRGPGDGTGPTPGPTPGPRPGPTPVPGPVSGPTKGVKKESPPPDGPPPPLDELDILNDKLKNEIIGAWKEVNYDKDPTKKYWWNEITNETTSLGAPKPTGLTATTPQAGFMSYDNPLKENSKTSFIVFVNLILYPGTSISEKERKKLECYLNYEEIRRSYAELFGYEYIPIPMNDPKYYKLENNNVNTKQIQNPVQNPTNSRMNTTRRVTFDTNPPQRIQGGKNRTKRNHK